MKKQKNRYPRYARKDKSVKSMADRIPPKAFRCYLNRKLRARNKTILRSPLMEVEEKIFYPCTKDLHFHYW